MKKITEVKSYLFDNYLIVSLSKDWVNVFGEIPRFKVVLDNKKQLCLIGPKLTESGDVVCE